MINTYKREHKTWITEYHQDCEDLLNAEVQRKFDDENYF